MKLSVFAIVLAIAAPGRPNVGVSAKNNMTFAVIFMAMFIVMICGLLVPLK